MHLRQMVADHVPTIGLLTTIATERSQQYGNARLVFDPQVEHHLVEIRAVIAAIAPGHMNALVSRVFGAVVAPIDMKAGTSERGAGGR